MKVFCALVAATFILSGCTSYKSMGFAGGFEETPLAANVYKIHTRGNAFASPSKVKAIALVRAAELTLNNGYDRFLIHSLENWEKSQTVRTSPGSYRSSGSAFVTPGAGGSAFVTGQSTTTYTPPSYTKFSKPHSELVVQMLKPGDAGYENGLNPRQIISTYGPEAGYKGS